MRSLIFHCYHRIKTAPVFLVLSLVIFTGCEGVMVVPSPSTPVVDFNDPDFYVVREAAKVSFTDMVKQNEPHPEIAIRMPSGVSTASYAQIVNAIPGDVTAVPDARTELPLYQIIRIEIRQEDATVVGVKPTADGPEAVTMDLKHDGIIYDWSWRIVRRRVWDMPVEKVLQLYDRTDYVPAQKP